MDLSHGKYLGVDYGDVRTGLAECDLSGTLAGAIATICEGGMKKTAVRVAREAATRGCKKIIVGKKILSKVVKVWTKFDNF